MKSLTPIILIFFFFSMISTAQEVDENGNPLPYDVVIQSELGGKIFKFSGNTRFNFNQAYFSNWVSGGESSLTGLFGLDYNFNYSDRKGLVWDSNLLLSLGTTFITGNTFFKKADDRFEIRSLVGKQINAEWNYSAFLKFKTQLLPDYRYFKVDGEEQREKTSQFFSPAIIQTGLGWYYKKNDNLWLNLSPLTARMFLVSQKFTRDLEEGKNYFGVEKGKRSAFFLGASITGYYKVTLMKNVIFENNYNFYVNYLENPQNVDVEWNGNLRFKVNDIISGNFLLHLIYDDDLIGELQFRELIGLGVNIDL